MSTKNSAMEFSIMSLDMKELSSQQKGSLAKIFDGKSELMLDKLIDDNCTLDIPTETGAVTVSIFAVLLDNKNITGTLRDNLIQSCSSSEDTEVKLRLATDARTPFEIQNKLADDENGDIRVELVFRKPPLISILKKLSADSNWAIRNEVIKSKYTTAEILDTRSLIESDDDVVLSIIDNKITDYKTIEKMSEKFFKQDGWFNEGGDLYDMGWNIKFIKALLGRVFESNFTEEELATNNILTAISNHKEEMYRLVPLKHPDTPASIYNSLYKDGDEFTKVYMGDNPKTSEALLMKFAQDPASEPLQLMTLSSSGFENVREAVAKHPNTLDIILKKLKFDNSEKVRKAVNKTINFRKSNDEKDLSSDLANL